VTTTQSGGYQLLIHIKNGLNGTSLTGATTVDLIDANGDLSQSIETVTVASASQASTGYFTPGRHLYFHVIPIGLGHYDGFFEGTVGPGGQVYEWIPQAPGCGATTVTFQKVLVGSMNLAGESTKYWDMPILNVYHIETAANVHYNLLDPTGTSMRTATGGTAASGTIFSGSSASNYTALTKTPTFKLLISLTEVSHVYGRPVVTLSSTVPYSFEGRFLAVWFSVNSTSISSSTTVANGWCLAPSSATPGFTNFYKFIPMVASTQTSTGFISMDIPLDTTSIAGATKLGVGVWVEDIQLPSAVVQGTYSAVYAQTGAFSDFAPAATIYASGFAVTASVPSGYVDHFVFTTG
jgi:hypothetical protein